MSDPTEPSIANSEAPDDAINIDDLAARSLLVFDGLPDAYADVRRQVEDVKQRLYFGELRLAVMGQFKRGKSTFINRLVGLDVLPASVVPVTSIPTFLRYGPVTRCTIKFFDGKPAVTVQQSSAEIKSALTSYVTEEKNPKNRFCVAEAIVECDNPVLQNGTTLIDTPGFGSTFIHNTKTTVDLIKGCDAVLFLLSADPPFTQTEVEFLKEVKRYVPRIFFIINKMDQLTPGELSKLDAFVKTVLSANLSFPPDMPLFHVSARAATASVLGTDPGGMGLIKTEIIDFMVREKYFTLSQAVSGKLKTALESTAQKLDADCRNLSEPLALAARSAEALDRQCEQVKIHGEKELSLIDAELRALGEFVDKTLNAKKEELRSTAKVAVERLITGALSAGGNPQRTVESAFGPLADEMFGRLYEQVANAVSKPLSKAVELPRVQYIKVLHEARVAAPRSVAAVSAGGDFGPTPEFPRFVSAHATNEAAAFAAVHTPLSRPFAPKETKKGRVIAAVSPVVERLMDERFEQLSLHIKNSIRKVCEACRQDLAVRYSALYEKMKAEREDAQDSAVAESEQTREMLKALTEKRRAVAELSKRLL
jgi:GTP-binding protein EngB required for normal cell division